MAIVGEALFTFLRDLRENNDREWFRANSGRYERDVVGPALALIDAVRPELEATSPQFEAVAKKVGGSMFRIHRDTRFSKDKTPYKTAVGLQLRHVDASRDVHAPGFYVHLEPGASGLGAGLWHPEPAVAKQLRDRIATDDGWDQVRAAVEASGLTWMGESAKRVPRGFPADHPRGDDLRRKDFVVWRPLTEAEAVSADLPRRIGGFFTSAAPLVRFACETLGLGF